MTTKLAAVNEILEGIGEPHASALDTNGTSDVAEAEIVLDRETRRIQESGPGTLRGWWFNLDRKVTLKAPTLTLTLSLPVTNGPFPVGSTVTGGTSGATGVVSWYDTSLSAGTTLLYLHTITGTFIAAETITSGSVSAVANGVPATVTEGPIGVTSNTLSIRNFVPDQRVDGPVEYRIVYQQGDRLYDVTNSDGPTFTFTSDVVVDRVVEKNFTDIPDIVADYIIKSASVRYQRWKKRGRIDDSMLGQELALAKSRAYREHSLVAGTNMLETGDAHRIIGNRRSLQSFGLNPHA